MCFRTEDRRPRFPEGEKQPAWSVDYSDRSLRLTVRNFCKRIFGIYIFCELVPFYFTFEIELNCHFQPTRTVQFSSVYFVSVTQSKLFYSSLQYTDNVKPKQAEAKSLYAHTLYNVINWLLLIYFQHRNTKYILCDLYIPL